MPAPDTRMSLPTTSQGPRLQEIDAAAKWPGPRNALPSIPRSSDAIPEPASSPRHPSLSALAPGNFLPFDRLDYLPATILGIVTHYVEPELRSKLRESANDLRVAEDLGLDSLAMMEVMMRVEDLLPVSISDKELRQLRTLGEIRRYIEQQVTG